ncbi:hypothetical protein ACH4E8_08135 [Streptomyces sp. NPDC017979]|uniref:hypothetical protein n=1 Tax=Streptomyces sp. NPDC017979 TaxID=3365024 RepID=UPI00378A09F3
MQATAHSAKALAPDGRWVSFACRARSVQDDWYWHFRLTSRSMGVGVSVTDRGYPSVLIEQLGNRPVQQLTYDNQPLQLLANPDGDGWQGIWTGPHHCLIMAFPGDRVDAGAVTGVLDQLVLTDTAAGLVVKPRSSEVSSWSLYGVKFTSGGSVTIYPAADAARLVPEGSAGKSVDHGEVWVKTMGIAGVERGRKFLHSGPKAVCLVDDELTSDTGVGAADQEELLQTLDVRWGA